MATRATFEANLRAGLYTERQGEAEAAVELKVGNRRLRRIITREQGCALETIGHAVDHLNDCYLQQGSDDEILDFGGPAMEAVQILIALQRQMLRSLPVKESFIVRVKNTLLHRRPVTKTSAVVPLSSSRLG